MFVRLAGMNASACFSGDADWIAEIDVSKTGNWSAQLLKAGHHGSRTSTGAPWLTEVKPETVVISCGLNNSYGHPTEETLNRIRRAGAAIARTDTEGTIVFEVQNGRFVRTR